MTRIFGSYPIEIVDSIVSFIALVVCLWNSLKIREILLTLKNARMDFLSGAVVDAHAEGIVEGRSQGRSQEAALQRERERENEDKE